ncbi:MAG: ATP-binding protein [Bdellovibrionaceae bacterium]|nr:ATP-binding protein [Pseudobdellovibrionaceae bacterium]
MNKNQKDASLAEELPYWDFVDGPLAHAILFDGSLVGGLKVSLIDIECFDESKTNHLTMGLRSALNSVSEGTSLQFVLGVRSDYSDTLRAHTNGKAPGIHPLVESIANFREKKLISAMSDGELYRPELFVYVRVPAVQAKSVSIFKKKELFSEKSAEAYEQTVEALGQNIETLISSFGSLGLSCRELNREELIQNIYTFLNPKRSSCEPTPLVKTFDELDLEKDVLDEVDWLATQSPREQLVFGDLVLGFEGFTLDGFYHRVVTLKTLPEVTYAGMISEFLRLPFHYDLILSLDVPPQADEMAKLQQKRKMAHSMAVTSGNKASDLESETKLSSTEELIRELLNTGQRIYATQLSVILKAPATPEGAKVLNRNVREVLARFRSLQGAEGLEESVGAWKVLKGSLPAAPLSLERARKMKTNNLADFLPVYGPREGDLDPVVLFRNRLNGLVSFNAFDPGLPNYNSLVTGSSGAGKSFLNNCILLQELARGLRVFIIDIGGSYKKLTEALGGQYLEINLSDQYRINPFDVANPLEEPSNQKIKSLLACIESMVSEDDKAKLPKLDRALLERAVIELYKSRRAEGEVPTLSDLARCLSAFEEESMRAIAKMLYLWTGERPYGRLLDGQGSLRTDASICTFDLKGLSSYPDLQSVMILILTDFILTQVEGDRTSKKRIILDEAWELLKSNAAASFMEYCARTLRKTGSGITFITQGVEEIVASPIGPAILNNTATKFIMLQRGDSEVLRETLKLNSQELNLIHSLGQKKGEYSEGFMIEGDHRQVVRIYPSPFEYWLSTSDAQDNAYLAELKESGLDLVQAIEKAAHHYPNGVAQGRNKEVA